MCLLREAAHAWQQLTGTEYRITVGRRGKKSSFALSFSFADFPHVAGMQYAQDVDFGLRPSIAYLQSKGKDLGGVNSDNFDSQGNHHFERKA